MSIKFRQESIANCSTCKLSILNSLKTGHPAYCIPVGGSNSIGVYGYIHAWQEMMDQNLFDLFDDIIVACGSGGSIAGLTIGNYLTGQKIK